MHYHNQYQTIITNKTILNTLIKQTTKKTKNKDIFATQEKHLQHHHLLHLYYYYIFNLYHNVSRKQSIQICSCIVLSILIKQNNDLTLTYRTFTFKYIIDYFAKSSAMQFTINTPYNNNCGTMKKSVQSINGYS